MEDLLAYLAREPVEPPARRRVGPRDAGPDVLPQLHWPDDDGGKVIGKQGNVARALRTVVRASAVRTGRRVHVEIAG